jgi:chloramphenicol-sensitive protein RarD
MPAGLPSAALAYVLWGLFPLYFHHISQVNPFEVILHRSVWSAVFVWGVLFAMRRTAWLGPVLRDPRQLGRFLLSAVLLSTNWTMYVWAVNNGHVLEASLGYFINPLVNVALGAIFLHERPRPWQWAALVVAAAGVAWLTVSVGRPPWIALTLAFSFGFYGLLRKTASLGTLEGLAIETLVLAPVAVPALAWLTASGAGALSHADAPLVGWLLFSGPLTAAPLLFFAHGARRLTLATMGVLQYISPTIQFALGHWWFGEALAPARLVGFVLIWAALAIYTGEGLLRMRQQRAATAGAGA